MESQARVSDEVYKRYSKDYGEAYREAQERVSAAFDNKQSIDELFTLPKRAQSKIKTEILFIERCLTLLKPGGRLGIVLPEGVFNNPSLQYVREFCEDRLSTRCSKNNSTPSPASSASNLWSMRTLQLVTIGEQKGKDEINQNLYAWV